ncbi:MAG: biopolymer transporter ExbD [Phycisphaerae bacterium]|nr:biopolymer transporter ExbD [Phycisphaerae bacterium]
MGGLNDRSSSPAGFNMTPIIDVVFLLIIFFMLVCQFIAAENFEVAVPDKILSAKPSEAEGEQLTTVTVMFDENGVVAYAVGAEVLAAADGETAAWAIAAAIDRQLANLPRQKRIVSLRCDKDVTFKHAKYALAGISQSSATDIKWAVIKHEPRQ